MSLQKTMEAVGLGGFALTKENDCWLLTYIFCVPQKNKKYFVCTVEFWIYKWGGTSRGKWFVLVDRKMQIMWLNAWSLLILFMSMNSGLDLIVARAPVVVIQLTENHQLTLIFMNFGRIISYPSNCDPNNPFDVSKVTHLRYLVHLHTKLNLHLEFSAPKNKL